MPLLRMKRPVVYGFIGSAILFGAYFTLLSIANSFSHAIEQFSLLWYWILVLVAGFGIQVGLYTHIRREMHERSIAATAEVTATGGISASAMAACCMHHLADIIPIIGISAAAVFLNRYQMLFIAIGVLSSAIGIGIMLNIIQKRKLYNARGSLFWLMKVDMKKALYVTVAFSAIILMATIITTR